MGSDLHFKVAGRAGDFAAATKAAIGTESEDAYRRIAKAHTGAVKDLLKADVSALRADIVGGGFYNAVKLSKTWQGRLYPPRESMEPAGFIFTKASEIIDAFTLGLTIFASNTQYLAIPEGPAKAIVRRLNQAKNRSRVNGQFADEAGTVQRVAAALGVDRLQLRINQATGRGVLVAAGKRVTRTGRNSAMQGDDTVLFALVRQATLKKRIRGRELLAQLQSSADSDIAAAIVENLDPRDAS